MRPRLGRYRRRCATAVSEAKKVATENGWEVLNKAMQIMGGIGYTSVYPVERLMRDGRLSLIWTGSNEIMNLLIQHEYYKDLQKTSSLVRNIEEDALTPDEEEESLFLMRVSAIGWRNPMTGRMS